MNSGTKGTNLTCTWLTSGYPVKSMAGEELNEASLTVDGIEGDRLVRVVSSSGRILTSRTRPGLLLHHGTLGPGGQPLVDGIDWRDPRITDAVKTAAGPDSSLTFDTSYGRFDILPLLIATDGAIEDFGRDYRRLRPNLVIGGVDGLAEREWPGRLLRIGDGVTIAIDSLRGRCIMTTFDPDTGEQDIDVLRDIVRRYDGEIALNCAVLTGGTIRQGDPVQLIGGDS